MMFSTGSVHELQAEVFKAIGHPIRLQIVKVLVDGERSVSDIVGMVGAEQSNVSRHLALLKQAGVLRSRKSGLKVYYGLRSTEFLGNLKCVLDCITQSAHGAAARADASTGAAAQPTTPLPSGESI